MKYKFRAKSSMSFPVTHCGRKQFINFTSMGNGTSMFITEDDGIAKKIRTHKWYREGRIKEEQVDTSAIVKADAPLHAPSAEGPKPYSIMGRGMSSTPYQAPIIEKKEDGVDSFGMGTQRAAVTTSVDAVDEAIAQNKEEETETEDAEKNTGGLQIPADAVSSLIEAKEFFSVNYGVDRSLVKSKEAVAKLCALYNVEFDNYPLS